MEYGSSFILLKKYKTEALMDKNKEYALFKFQIISPVINDPSSNHWKYFQEMANREYDLEFTKQKRFSPNTFKKWLHIYRMEGFDGLLGSTRKDKGCFRALGKELKTTITELAKSYEFRTVKNLYDHLIREKIISENDFTYTTLNNFIKANKLFNPDIIKKERKAFEASFINELWMSDLMYGPKVYFGNRKLTSYLCAILDDYSRLIVSACFHPYQSEDSLIQTLKKAVFAYGLPVKFYCDNAKIFYSKPFKLILAKLGICLIHSKAHDAASRGKIERFFRTVRDRFIPNFHIGHPEEHITLEILNSEFKTWCFQEYNDREHSAIKTSPINRYMADMEKTHVRNMDSHSLEAVFMHSIIRMVYNDGTISIDGSYYEVPGRFIGQKVEIRFDLEKKVPYLYENNARVCEIKKLDRQKNSIFPIRFNQEDRDV
jgi:transposase InsO family protein